MNESSTPETDVTPFRSLVKMQQSHGVLLELYNQFQTDEIDKDFKDRILDFMERGIKTGAILNFEDDRADAQTYLNYWATVLYDAGESPRPPVLDRFDKNQAAKESGEKSPYRGLRAFDKENRTDFFGRRKLINNMVELIRQKRFLAVVGLSGSGKSSLVRAGLLPLLEEGAIGESEKWLYLEPALPGRDPLLALVNMTSEIQSPAQDAEQEKALFLENAGYLLEILNKTGSPVVVTIDQFEELFTLAADENKRDAFVANLTRLISTPNSPHVLILTMRSEFDMSVARYPELQELFDNSQVRVTSLTVTELRKAIEMPAQLRGVTFETGLLEELAQRVQGEPAGLPLLQFTLQQLWDNRDGNTITWEKYKELGGSPKTILSNVADKTLESFNLEQDAHLSRRIFLRLIRPKAGLDEVTSNREKRRVLYSVGEAERVDRVLDVWEKAGLLRVTRTVSGENNPDDQVEVMHEALIRNWTKLIDWIDDERQRIRERLLFAATAEQWWLNKDTPNAGGFLGGAILEKARLYDDLTEKEKAFVLASEQHERRIEREREEQVKREDEARRNKTRLAWAFLIVSLFLLTIAGSMTLAAFNNSRRADAEAEAGENSNESCED